MKEDKGGRACSLHGTEDKFIEDLDGKTRKGKICLKFNGAFLLVLLNERLHLFHTKNVAPERIREAPQGLSNNLIETIYC
jgi:hypothetical protein